MVHEFILGILVPSYVVNVIRLVVVPCQHHRANNLTYTLLLKVSWVLFVYFSPDEKRKCFY